MNVVAEGYYQNYIKLVESNETGTALKYSLDQTHELFEDLSEEVGDFAYAPGKWTIKQLLQHLIDTERVFIYRALRFARNDKTELPGYDQDTFAMAADVSSRSLHDILVDYELNRQSSISFFKSLSEQELDLIGTCSGMKISVGGIGLLIPGHDLHHLNVIKTRYLGT